MARLWHANLVHLLSYCNEVDKRKLIYGYMLDIGMESLHCIICLAYDQNWDHNRSLSSLLQLLVIVVLCSSREVQLIATWARVRETQ